MPDAFDLFTPKDRGRFGDNEYSNPRVNAGAKSTLVDIECELRSDDGRKRAIAVTPLGAGADVKWIWLPRDLIEFEKKGALVSVTLPRWLAKEKGLI